jgi:lipoprotein-anchoring transpeptidase ErfK/SrfK
MQRSIIFATIVVFVSVSTVEAQTPSADDPPATPPMVVAAQPQLMRSDLGGGFIEFLFGDARPAQSAPRGDVDQAGYPAGPQDGMDPRYERREVVYQSDERPGTIIIDTPNKFLYLIESDSKALRYGIGVGRPGFTWAGTHKITAKKEWPDWVPPEEMLKRQPYLPHFMAGGPDNPLGARALYIGGTLYRIHGSNEPWTIGHNVSSGCIRLRNADVIDLYNRVQIGATVVVL